MDPSLSQSHVSLVSMRSAQNGKDHNPFMTHDIILPRMPMAPHAYRKALSIGIVLRDTVFTMYMTQQVDYFFWGYFLLM